MGRNQNETGEFARGKVEGGRGTSCALWHRREFPPSAFRLPPSAFTLTELLVVITIIAILAALITGAAVNALRRSKQATITLEITQLASSLEDFKNVYGAYPPNGMAPLNPAPLTNFQAQPVQPIVEQDFILMFKKAFPRNLEPDGLIARLAGSTANFSVADGNPSALAGGLTAEEALVFWLGGFSDDPVYPISGPGGPSFSDTRTPNGLDLADEVLEDRNRRYEFDLGRLGPRTTDGVFDVAPTGKGRWLTYQVTMPSGPPNQLRRINLWTYKPSGSQVPLVYFDTSRHDPIDYDVALLGNATNAPRLFALKTVREGLATAATIPDLNFVNKGKFQILHAGIDDIWGEGLQDAGLLDRSNSHKNINNPNEVLQFPTGPFLGDVADTVGNFGTGTLADAQE